MPLPRDPRPHIRLPDDLTSTRPYQAPNSRAGKQEIPEQDRPAHAAHLRASLKRVATDLTRVTTLQRVADWDEGFGLSVRFSSFAGVDLALDSLDLKSHGIELLSVREQGNATLAAVWVPEGKLSVFEHEIAAYLARTTDSRGRPRDHRKLLDAIQEIRTAIIEDLWTADSPVPADEQVRNFEAWLSTPRTPTADGAQTASRRRSRRSAHTAADVRIQRFLRIAQLAGFSVGDEGLRFPEHTVFQVRGTFAQWRSSAHLLGQLAELRPAPETPTFFMSLPAQEQRDWATELLMFSQIPQEGAAVPHVCILDTGGYVAHPLLAPGLAQADLHTVNPSWGVADQHGHGTQQAGLALWGDLASPLASQQPVVLGHRLESVKLLNMNNANQGKHFGNLTRDAVSLPEIAIPNRKRLFSLAVTADPALRGKPTAWSAEVDALASDWAGDGEAPRLLIVSGGNVDVRRSQYPARNELTSIEDPAQAWNALTVGALTYKTQIQGVAGAAYQPVAPAGGLSPHSATSGVWHREAPFKPDVVFEGGNCADDGQIVTTLDSTNLLTTSHASPRLFDTSFGTSPATALASNFAAKLMARYPEYWPETIRALTIHSARWTPVLLQQFGGLQSKDDIELLLRRCGWGEPELDLALHSGADSLTLIVQQKMQPFVKGQNGNIKANAMQLHRLPWPKRVLQDLGNLDVELRVTLSYFIEPSPGERGRRSRYAYASHGLRFAMQKPLESAQAFSRRINQLVQDEEDGIGPKVSTGDPNWSLGFRKRFRGSLHHDRWKGKAVELANREQLAVFPTSGWWKTRDVHGRYTREARYALIASIHAPDLPVDVDLYAALQSVLAPTPVEVSNEIS
jgi:hypothetical protein